MLGINFKSPASDDVDSMVDKMKRKKILILNYLFFSSKRAENTSNIPWFQPKVGSKNKNIIKILSYQF